VVAHQTYHHFFCFFFFSCSRDHRALHSFPTRRSSDLVDGKSSQVSIDGVADAVMTPLRSPVSGEENNVKIVKDGGFIWAEGEIADRKSTRLNSSHLVISYAVFCLKKKKKNLS